MKRNLSKVLTLILALALVLGMMTMGASAAFTDDADITYKDAVGLLSGFGVINGIANADGTYHFDPKGNFDRGGLAKMVAYFSWGGADLSNYYKGSSVFTDLAGYEWAAGAINYGYNAGYINGVDAKSYDPDGTVTGSMLAKTLLVVLGYDPKSTNPMFALEGANWELNSIRIAQQSGLFAGLGEGYDPTKALTREEAAQIFYNAAFEPTVSEYKDDGSPKAIGGAAIADSLYNLDVDGGYVKYNAANNSAVCKLTTGNTTVIDNGTEATYKVDTGLDMLGKSVVVAFNDVTGKVYYVKDLTCAEVVITATMTAAEVKAAFNAAGVTDSITANSMLKVLDGVVTENSNTAITLGTTAGSADVAATYIVATDGVTKEVVARVLPTTYAIDSVASISTTANAETITFTGLGAKQNNKTSDVVAEYADIKQGDTVIYYVVDGVYYLTKATTVQGKLEKIGTDAGSNPVYTIGGKDYTKTALATTNDGLTNAEGTEGFTKEYVLYLDHEGKWIEICDVQNAPAVQSDIVYVNGVYTNTTADAYGTPTINYYAQTVDLAGAEGKVLIGVKVGNAAVVGVDTLVSGFKTFAVSSTPAAAALGIQTASNAPTSWHATNSPVFTSAINKVGGEVLTVASTYITTDAGKAYLNSNTAFLFIKGAGAALETKVVTGGINSTVANDALVVLSKDADGNYVVNAVIAGTEYTNAGLNASDYIYVADAQTTPAQVPGANSTTNYVYTVYNAATGASMTINATNTTIAASGFYAYKVVDGVYTIGEKVTEATAPAAGAYYAEAYTSKFGTKITTTQMSDVEAGAAIVVDTRTAAEIAADEVPAITDLATINTLKLAQTSKTATFDCMKAATGVSIIFITAVA